MNSKDLLHNILSDMRVELSEEFDRNFERKAFFSDKWKRRANPNAIYYNSIFKLLTVSKKKLIYGDVSPPKRVKPELN